MLLIEAATGNWSGKQMFWNTSLKPLENICEEVHFSVNKQALGLQPNWIWSPLQVFLWILTVGLQPSQKNKARFNQELTEKNNQK